ncbi:MAG TPA: translation elongation factor-like protein [Candidatus Omnitrophota bacterium]|nr:translation elongation factor-like protein [Candidatus Omnitrophota bacterium]
MQPKPVCVGKVTHFFSRIQVVVVKLKGPLRVGNQVHIKGKTTNFKQKIRSIQIESVDVPAARKGQLVGLKVDKKAKEGDEVFLLS